MHTNKFIAAFLCLLLVAASGKHVLSREKQPAEEKILMALVGSWEGSCKTWFEPGKLADSSPVKGEIKAILGKRIFRHSYTSEILGKPRIGEDTLAFDATQELYQSSWFDDFHMNYALLLSQGEKTERGFSVSGSYRAAKDLESWGWRTEFELVDADHLTITAYNITPSGQEGKAVQTVYSRVKLESE